MSTKPQNFKIDLRPGAQLSQHFRNCRDHYKVVEGGNVIGYAVSPATPHGAAAVYPLYTAFIHTKVGDTWHMMASYEQGDRLNDYTFEGDYQGCTLATIAAQAIAALEARPPAQGRFARARERSEKQPRLKKRERSR